MNKNTVLENNMVCGEVIVDYKNRIQQSLAKTV